MASFALWTCPRGSALPWRMYALPKPGYDPETMRAVGVAYRRERQAVRWTRVPTPAQKRWWWPFGGCWRCNRARGCGF